MQVNYTGHNMDITPSMKDFAQKKFDKLSRHYDRMTAINAIFKVEKLRQIAEATILVNKAELHASAESDDMYTAIDLLIEKLDKQLLKHKNKTADHRE